MGKLPNMTTKDWDKVKVSRGIDSARSYSDIYKSHEAKTDYLPLGVTRESRDSENHPESTAIVLGLDSTGSMSSIYEMVAKRFGELMLTILNGDIVPHPQIMFSAIDDSFYCDTPLQVTQFEVDAKIAEQLFDLHFTGRGGGNRFESYPLLWYFCSRHTAIDCYEKRGVKGFIVTVGDDNYPNKLTAKEIKDVFGDTVQDDILTSDIVDEVNRKYEIYHISLEQGGSFFSVDMKQWEDLLGTHSLQLSDYEKLPELIISLMKVHYGEDIDKAIECWDGTTGMIVKKSLEGLRKTTGDSTGIVRM